MYAIVRSGGRQHKVAVGDVVEIDRVEGEPGATLTLPALLVVDGANVTTDAKALDCARHAVAAGFDRKVGDTGRTFFYLPFEHAEDMASQDRALELFNALAGWEAPGSPYQYARRHWDIIRRFGRFPHRNKVLGRVSTPAEAAFLTLPDS